MKNTLLVLSLLIGFPLAGQAQQVNSSIMKQDTTTLYNAEEVDQQPVFTLSATKYGQVALMQFLGERFRISPTAHRANASGEVLCNFVIDAQGNMSDLRVVQSVHRDIDAEALRVCRLTKDYWKPAIKDGVAVASIVTLPYRIVTMQDPGGRMRKTH